MWTCGIGRVLHLKRFREHPDRSQRRFQLVGNIGHKLRPQLGNANFAARVAPEEIPAEKGEWHNEQQRPPVKGSLEADTRMSLGFQYPEESLADPEAALLPKARPSPLNVDLKFRRVAMGHTVGLDACTDGLGTNDDDQRAHIALSMTTGPEKGAETRSIDPGARKANGPLPFPRATVRCSFHGTAAIRGCNRQASGSPVAGPETP